MLTLENLGPKVNDSWDSDPSENPAFILDFGFKYGESFVLGIFKLDFDLGKNGHFFGIGNKSILRTCYYLLVEMLCNLNPFLNKPWFLHVCSTSLLKTLWKKEKLLVTSNSSFSPQFFLPVWRTLFYFHQILNCRLQTISVWKSLKFVVWESVKVFTADMTVPIYIFNKPKEYSIQNALASWSIS